ncbi:hypothetical protein [uncultured Desulfobacter sp.]|uniref:hypothetical protein n=1 Tax=uncultured Desulfobacter sp. TaxID=240139 RepID=UPI002AAAD3CE|nr:hypothetical protein [uncultured Desulfobacter sp.]
MRRLWKESLSCLLAVFAVLARPAFCADSFFITGPPVAESLAFAVMADRNLAGPGIEFIMWNSPDQARAMIAAGKIRGAVITTGVAALFYNKGARVRIAGVFSSPLWVVSEKTHGETPLRGTLLFPFGPGEMPELLFQAAMGDSTPALATGHTGGALEAVNRLLMARAEHALLAEPAASMAVIRSRERSDGPQLFKHLDMRNIWAERFNNRPLCASSFAIFDDAVDCPERIRGIIKGYGLALEWIAAHPEEAMSVVRKKIPALADQSAGLSGNAGVIHTDAATFDATGFFLGKIYAMDPGAVGGKLPGSGLFLDLARATQGP